ncbi:MAG: SDR family oxidoreductase [Bdellovibrionales bacterium]|nr:SDR family oxidoreductase [Bdellovibrionales bacterium]
MNKLSILVTGASSGIGAALAEGLARAGHEVWISARREERLKSLAARNPGMRYRICDVAEEDQVQGLFATIHSVTPKLDAIINAAGLFGAIGRMDQTNPQEWRRAFDVNTFGTYLVIKYGMPFLLQPGSAKRIINFSGGGAFSPFASYSAYAVSKAAVVRLTENLAVEMASEQVAANCIAPGFIKTEIHEATLRTNANTAGSEHHRKTKELMESDDNQASFENCLECVKFLLSPEANGLTGKTISVNFDPWRSPGFRQSIGDMAHSDLYTQRRVNLVNLPQDEVNQRLQTKLSKTKQ